jgi:hypothetical protein
MKDRGITQADEADPNVDAAWKSASQEEPPARVDAAILAAARDATQEAVRGRADAARRSAWLRWQPLAAAAGIAGLALVLVQRLPTDAPVEESVRAPALEREQESAAAASPESKPTPAPETAPVPASVPAPATAPAESFEAPLRSNRSAGTSEAATDAGAVIPPTTMQAQSSKATDDKALASTRAEMARAPAADAVAATEGDAAPSGPTPEQWATRIHELHRSGQLALAAAELRTFRRLHADADEYLPRELQAWAATVESPAPE